MKNKFLYLLIIFFTNCFASYEQIKIGKIDNFYYDKLSIQQLKTIIDEIEHTLETQVNTNIFDYSPNGKPIDILFVPDSKLENDISKKIDKLNSKKEKLESLKDFFSTQKNEINRLEDSYTIQTNLVNNSTFAHKT